MTIKLEKVVSPRKIGDEVWVEYWNKAEQGVVEVVIEKTTADSVTHIYSVRLKSGGIIGGCEVVSDTKQGVLDELTDAAIAKHVAVIEEINAQRE